MALRRRLREKKKNAPSGSPITKFQEVTRNLFKVASSAEPVQIFYLNSSEILTHKIPGLDKLASSVIDPLYPTVYLMNDDTGYRRV
jgi:hypothetical protein